MERARSSRIVAPVFGPLVHFVQSAQPKLAVDRSPSRLLSRISRTK